MKTLTSRERVRRAVNFQTPDRVPIDLGAMKASSIAVRAYNAVKQSLGIAAPSRIWDPKFMVACVEEAVRQRLHLDVVPLDVSSVVSDLMPNDKWAPSALYAGAEGLLPPDTRIGTDPGGNWVLLDSDGSPTSYHMPREGYYFDDVSFNKGGGANVWVHIYTQSIAQMVEEVGESVTQTDVPDFQICNFVRY